MVGGAVLVALLVFVAAPSLTPQRPTAPRSTRERVWFWHMWTAEWKVVVDRIVARYNASQDQYEVIALSVPSAGADTKFLLSAVGGHPPDLMAQWNAVIPTWADNNLLIPLDTLMTPEEKRRFEREAYPIVKKVGTYKGRLYGITIGLNGYGCYYLPKHFRDAGLDPDRFPETLEELVAVGEKLHRFDKAGNLQRVGFMPRDIRQFAPLFGGGFYDWERGRLTLNTPENLRALEFLVEIRKKLGYDRIVRFESGLDTGSFAGGWPFIGGAYSVTGEGPYRVEQIAKNAPDLEYRTALMPPPKGGVPLAHSSGGNFMIIPKGARNVPGAWDFLKFWSGLENPERAAEFYTWGGWLPLSPAVANAPKYQEYLHKYPQFATFLKTLPSENLQAIPPVAFQVFLVDQIGKAEDAAIRGTLTPKQALENLEAVVAREQQRRKELGYAE